MKGYTAIVGVLAVIILSLVTLNGFFRRTLQLEMAEQFNRQQLLLARAEATNIQTYLDRIKNQTISSAKFSSGQRVPTEQEFAILTKDAFVDIGSVKNRISFLDSGGKALFSDGTLMGTVVYDKTLLDQARAQCPREALVTHDHRIISFIAPVCRKDFDVSAVALSLDIQDIATMFLAQIKSGSRGYAWMMDRKGNLLYHPAQPDMVGRNLYRSDSSCFTCHTTFDTEKKIIEGITDSYGRYVAPTGEDKILAFSTAAIGDSRWIVAVSAPYSEVTMSIRRSLKFYSWIVVLMFAATAGVCLVLIDQYRKRARAEERAKYEKEIELMHSEKLASLDRLTAGISREIGNPMTSVFAFVKVLMDMETDELKRETLETIHFHLNRMKDTLKQLSGFSKLPSIERSRCRVNALIEESLSLVQYDERVQGITIMKDLSRDIPEVLTDRGQLEQVIVNIVLNAVDAMPDGGVLTIRSNKGKGHALIEFSDTGAGIEKDNISRIFDPFYTTKEQGKGLGLAVSYNIMNKLGGSLSVVSEPGKGSQFILTLPLAEG